MFANDLYSAPTPKYSTGTDTDNAVSPPLKPVPVPIRRKKFQGLRGEILNLSFHEKTKSETPYQSIYHGC